MIIPDYIDPLIAYRTWDWDARGLTSLNHEPWVPGQAMVATCNKAITKHYMKPKVHNFTSWVNTRVRGASPSLTADGQFIDLGAREPMTEAEARWFFLNVVKHESPVDDCRCGIYAAKDFAHLVRIKYAEKGIHGQVALWGSIIECEVGYRAQYGYPKNFVIPMDVLPPKVRVAEEWLKNLSAFNVDMFLTESRFDNGESSLRVPLWVKDYGWKDDGLRYFQDEAWRHETLRGYGRGIQPGTQITVVGKGTGVVWQIITDFGTPYVLIKFGKRTVFKTRLSSIHWSEENCRWESDRTWSEMVRSCFNPTDPFATAPIKNDPAEVARIMSVLGLPKS